VSEYQCYEFLALDRRLTAQEMAELRSISTRAEITPTRFWNEYQWGDLKADPSDLLARYFDMHLYIANWGTRRLMFRLPVTAVDLHALRAYAPGGPVTLTTTGEYAVLDLWSEVEEPEDDWFEAGHLAASLTPLRAELLRGDRRVAYVAWLLAVQAGEVSSRTREPPVPRDLDAESGPQAALAEFLRLDRDLLAAAAEGGDQEGDEADRFRAWVKSLPVQEQERWLLRAADNPDLPVGSELLGEFRRAHPPVTGRQRRTVTHLQARAEELRAARRRAAAERAAQARAAAAAARSKRLAGLARRGEAAWRELEQLVEARSYDEAVRLAIDLRDAAAHASEPDEFDRRIAEVKQRYARRRGFLDRLRRTETAPVDDAAEEGGEGVP
jgi:hypothetical protein